MQKIVDSLRIRKIMACYMAIFPNVIISCPGRILFQHFPPFIFKYRPVHKTDVTLKAKNFIDICSIPSKFYMCMYDRMKNIYAQNQSSIHCSCVQKAVHNRTFWIILVSLIYIFCKIRNSFDIVIDFHKLVYPHVSTAILIPFPCKHRIHGNVMLRFQ